MTEPSARQRAHSLRVLLYPDGRLRRQADPVERFDAELGTFLDALLLRMYAERGIGLAANQVGDPRRACVLDVSERRNEPLFVVNPRITRESGLVHRFAEGCLSLPGHSGAISRFARVTVRYQQPDGQSGRIDADGLLAIALQHEIDHLDGKLFADDLGRSARDHIGHCMGTERWTRPKR